MIIGVSAFAVAAYVIGSWPPMWRPGGSELAGIRFQPLRKAKLQSSTAQFGMAWGGALFGRGLGQDRPPETPVASFPTSSRRRSVKSSGWSGLVRRILILSL